MSKQQSLGEFLSRISKSKKQDKLYVKFRKAWEIDPLSSNTVKLAKKVKDKFVFGFSDADTPLAENREQHAFKTGVKLKEIIPLPDVVYLSPYIRARQTLDRIIKGWPGLKEVVIQTDKLIREQEKGLESHYVDRRIMFTLHPEQKKLFDSHGLYWYRYPNGENIPDVRQRVQSWLNKVSINFSGKNVLTVAHYVSILAIVANLSSFSDKQFVEFLEKEEPDTCGVTIFKNDSGVMKLNVYNAKLYE